jgi:DNA-binding NtrC family response regulator
MNTKNILSVLLVDDDPESLHSTARILEYANHRVHAVMSAQEALLALQAEQPDLVITDVRMPGMSGLEFIEAYQKLGFSIPFFVMTAFGDVKDAVWAMKLGAVDFLLKPFKRQALLDGIEQLKRRLSTKKQSAIQGTNTDLIGSSRAMLKLQMLIEQIAKTEASVLITGESGSGKEQVAKLIHQKSAHASGPFVAVNCAAIPENLLESELFGYERGAFSGAHQAKMGLFESAQGGSLLLDEIGDMPLSLQPKLLRVLEEQEIRRLGSNQTKKIAVRLIAATHQNLMQKVKAQEFRQDLYYRLDVMTLAVPSLRDRVEDIPLLIRYFLERFSSEDTQVDDEAMKLLLQHSWPGNVRELSNVIERAVVLASNGVIHAHDLPLPLQQSVASVESRTGQDSVMIPLGMSLKQVEEIMIKQVLDATQGDRAEAARLLGVNERTIYRKINKSKEE